MLSPSKVGHVRTLLAANKFTQRQIAQMAGVSRGSVGFIAAGKRHGKAAKTDEMRPHGPPKRCRACGGLVRLPCRLCIVRALVARRGPVPRRDSNVPVPIGLDLSPECHARYEEVRAQMLELHRASNPQEDAA